MDDSERNIAGAQAVGMQTLHWPSAGQGWLAFQPWRDRYAPEIG
jgi:FMN phosphatase YigB (HAD superfamily)